MHHSRIQKNQVPLIAQSPTLSLHDDCYEQSKMAIYPCGPCVLQRVSGTWITNGKTVSSVQSHGDAFTTQRVDKHRRTCRTFRREYFLAVMGLLLFYFSLAVNHVEAIKVVDDDGSTETYEWESYNFYEILGLIDHESSGSSTTSTAKPRSRKQRQSERDSLHSADVRKAYRKQAQLYHPDKHIHRKNTTSTLNKSNKEQKLTTTGKEMEALSVEESTARFAKIAEAYEVLSDAEKRQEYDIYLLDYEDEMEYRKNNPGGGGNNDRNTGGDYKSSRHRQGYTSGPDPASLFEEFFFGESGSDQYYSDYSHTMYGSKLGPSRIQESTQFRYDPRYGTEVMRILRKEEFFDPATQRVIYFRIIGQEFVEEFVQTYRGVQSLGYTPITEPYLVEEGELASEEDNFRGQQNNRGSNQDKGIPDRRYPSKLLSDEYLTPSTPLMTSSNGQFYAGLTPECELLIMSKSGNPNKPDELIWSSETFVPPRHGQQNEDRCVLSIMGPQLYLFLGSVGDLGRPLWHSESPAYIIPNASNDGESHEYIFYCSLDDDGSLAIYKRKGHAFDSQRHDDNSEKKDNEENIPLWYKLWLRYSESKPDQMPDFTPQYQTHSGKAWKSTQRWLAHILLLNHIGERPGGLGNGHNNDQCVYATGPMGCYSPGRDVLQFTADAKRFLEKSSKDLHDLWDKNIDEDEDIIDLIARIFGKTGNSLGKLARKQWKRFAQSLTRKKRSSSRRDAR